MDLIEVVEAAKGLFALDYREMLEMAVLQGAAIAGSERCCIIIENKKGELVLKSGFPKSGHGIGEKINSDERGEKMMRKVMNNGGLVWIDRPIQDDRTQYLRPLSEQHNISAVVFIPLFCSGESLGLIVFDFTGDQEKNLRDNLSKMKIFSEFVAKAMKVLYRQREHEEQILRQDRLSLIGQNAAGIAHSIRNSATTIGLILNRLNKNIMDASFKKYAPILIKESDKITKVVGDILRFTRFSADNFNVASHNINDFLSEAALKFSRAYNLKIDFSIGEKIILRFDKDLLEDCVHDLVRNAKEAGAKRVTIEARAKSSENEESDVVVITLTNDGESIPNPVINHIFDPFVTTKSRGTGLGLANVKMIISAHGGDIKVKSGAQTRFSIFLPL